MHLGDDDDDDVDDVVCVFFVRVSSSEERHQWAGRNEAHKKNISAAYEAKRSEGPTQRCICKETARAWQVMQTLTADVTTAFVTLLCTPFVDE